MKYFWLLIIAVINFLIFFKTNHAQNKELYINKLDSIKNKDYFKQKVYKFDDDELKSIAEKIAIIYSQLYDLKQIMSLSMVEHPQTQLSNYDLDFIKQQFNTLIPIPPIRYKIGVNRINSNMGDSLFKIFQCNYYEKIYNDTLSGSEEYGYTMIIALNYYGKYYKLYGFENNDFEKLVKDYLLPIKNENDVNNIVNLYLTNVKYNEETEEIIIDSAIFKNYSKINKRLELPKIEKGPGPGDIYLVNIQTYKVKYNEITNHNFILSNSGLFGYDETKIENN